MRPANRDRRAKRQHAVVLEQHRAALGSVLDDARVRLDVLRRQRVPRRVVEPAEALDLPEHVPDRAIDVGFDYAAACEGLAEFAGNIPAAAAARLTSGSGAG